MVIQDSVLYQRKLSQYKLFFSALTYINTFIMLLIVYFYYTVWMLEILAPYTFFFFF